jgi:hypothetical protein
MRVVMTLLLCSILASCGDSAPSSICIRITWGEIGAYYYAMRDGSEAATRIGGVLGKRVVIFGNNTTGGKNLIAVTGYRESPSSAINVRLRPGTAAEVGVIAFRGTLRRVSDAIPTPTVLEDGGVVYAIDGLALLLDDATNRKLAELDPFGRGRDSILDGFEKFATSEGE